MERDNKGRFLKGHKIRNKMTEDVKEKIRKSVKKYYENLSEKDRKKYGEINIGNSYRLGKTFSKKVRSQISNSLKGNKLSKETKIKIGNAHRGEYSHLWKGGVSPQSKLIRRSLKYRLWREAVFERDNYTCQKTGARGCHLHPHHILNFAQYPELILDVNNGITLSKEVHNKFHEVYGRKNNTKQQLQEFLEGTAA